MRGSVSGVLRRKLDGTNMLRGEKRREKRQREQPQKKRNISTYLMNFLKINI